MRRNKLQEKELLQKISDLAKLQEAYYGMVGSATNKELFKLYTNQTKCKVNGS